MAKLIYSAIASLDGYVEDENGRFEWAEPDAEVHAFVNELERPTGTYLYGRRMYETMLWWETLDTGPAEDARADDDADPLRAVTSDYAELWRAADKIVYSRTLDAVSSARTRIEREFDPDAIRDLKRTAAADISIGGSELAGQALGAGLVDELRLLINPVIVGGGKPALPDRVWTELELIDERRFQGGVVHVSYRVAR
jgi:dihydrofolate reductase